jgi:hypothetical protein
MAAKHHHKPRPRPDPVSHTPKDDPDDRNPYFYDGKSGGIDQGYYVTLPGIAVGANRPTCYLENNVGKRVYLWVTDVTAGFEMGGSFAQSATHRTFYPRNFVQPTMTFKGVMPNQYAFAKLGEFVRGTQLRAVRDGNGGRVVRLVMPKTGGSITHKGKEYHLPKGKRRAYDMDGYVVNMKRGAKRFENVPQFEFDFVIATSRQGLFHTDAATVSKLLSWSQIPNIDGYTDGFVNDPDTIKNGRSKDGVRNIGRQNFNDAADTAGQVVGAIENIFDVIF